MIDKSAIEEITQQAKAGRNVSVTVHEKPDDELSDQLRLIAHQIVEPSQGVFVVSEHSPSPPASPALTLSSATHGTIHYMALPEGPEEKPFLELLEGLVSDGNDPTAISLEQAELLVFIGATCPHCPHAVRSAMQVAVEHGAVTTAIIDVQRYPDLEKRFGVKAVPLTVLDGGLGMTGVVTPEVLIERISSRNSAAFDHLHFASLLESGRLAEAKEQLTEERGAVAFLSNWEKSTTSVRIPMMLVAGEVIAQKPDLFTSIVMRLVDLLGAEDAALRGDTADLLGQIGDDRAIDSLESLRGDPNPDVREIAVDSLEMIRETS